MQDFIWAKEHAPVFDELKKNVENHAVDFSQINILDYDDNHSYYEALVCQQAKFIQFYENDAIDFISDKIKTKRK